MLKPGRALEVAAAGTIIKPIEGTDMPFKSLPIFALLFVVGIASAQVQVEGAWVRPTVQGQLASGGFMKLTAKETTRLVRVSTPAAGVTEIHEMKMEGDIMKMRAVTGLDLPGGTAVELKPGSYHLMLMDLKAPLAKDSVLPMTFVFKNAKGVESKMQVSVPVASKAPGGMAMQSGERKH